MLLRTLVFLTGASGAVQPSDSVVVVSDNDDDDDDENVIIKEERGEGGVSITI
jgi:hypothetical protein